MQTDISDNEWQIFERVRHELATAEAACEVETVELARAEIQAIGMHTDSAVLRIQVRAVLAGVSFDPEPLVAA